MFTIGDIRNIAIQIEKNGEETYRQVSRVVVDEKIKELLLWMADEEEKHASWFAELRSEKVLSEEQRELENVGKTLLQDMVRGNTFLLDPDKLKESSSLKEVLQQAAAFEQDTVLFYEFLKGFLDDQKTTEQLDQIIEEERSHLQKLEEICSPVGCD